nr:MAG TPA: phosphoadenosine-phosphosulfate reductase [Caudoviricetes sp.]
MNHSIKELQELQALPLKYKIMLTEERIREWVTEFGEDGVYISFSGGKDSTVLLHIVRGLYPNIPAVFVDTGLEYPEIREFVKTFDNVVWLKPKKNFKRVIEDYGYPLIGKDIAENVFYAKKYIMGETKKKTERYKQLMGVAKQKNGKPSVFNYSKYKFMLNAPFEISSRCCKVMKKAPIKAYQKETGRAPITGQMASESRRRTIQWLKSGCNAFDAKNSISNPMSFWTEQDVLLYIKEENIPICSVYGDIVEDNNRLITTGCKRTGCVFCGFGCHLEKEGEGRFLKLKETHPKLYAYIMRTRDKGGLGYKEVIDWLNEHGGLNIEY